MKTKKLNPKLIKILSYLSDGKPHSGEHLADKLDISRTAIWKHMKHLQALGAPIVVDGNGYTLNEPFSLLDEQVIAQAVKPHVKKMHLFESITSTNDFLLKEGTTSPELCISEEQTKGHGRLGRQWYSPIAMNMYASLRYKFNCDASMVGGLSLVVGIALVDAFKKMFDVPLKLKWPNDLYLGDKKLAGILIQLQTEAYGTTTAIIGMGININLMSSRLQAVSLRSHLGHYIHRSDIVGPVVMNVIQHLDRFNEEGFAVFRKGWEALDLLAGKEIEVASGEQIIAGIARGVNESGCLLMDTEEGQKVISSGDASLKSWQK